MPEAYAQISPTAKLVVEMRRYSDVAYAEDIARAVGSAEAMAAVLDREPFAPGVLSWMAPLTEARYKSLTAAIVRSGAPQVLELASGFAFRGAMLASPRLRYIETDLADVHAERVRLRAQLEAAGTIARIPQLIFEPLDIMRADDVARVAALLAPGEPVAIVHEGLFQYLSLDEKRTAALAIADFLDRAGGVWCTPDFETMDDALHRNWTDPQFMKIGAFIARSTRRNMVAAAFTSREHVRTFFGELGFTVELAPQLDGSFELTSAVRTGATAAQVAAMRDSRVVWKLTR